MNVEEIIYSLYKNNNSSEEELLFLIQNIDKNNMKLLIDKADEVRRRTYENKVYIRGLIEISNYCKKNCMYCGIRRDNTKACRYRLTKEEILECARRGNDLGYKTFVLQGGEDPYYTDEIMVDIISSLKKEFPNNAITLSLGEKSHDSYKAFFDAGADRYLLRHETASKKLYEDIHPGEKFGDRINCLKDLKEIGYQTGAGFMVGIPNQTDQDLVNDLIFLKEFQPAMCGIGPFISHKDTPFSNYENGGLDKTITILAITRLLLPQVLLPSTTALSSIDPKGRELGIKAGCNVIMPNLSPMSQRKKYSLYDNKAYILDEDAEYRKMIDKNISEFGFKVEESRGDNPNFM